MSCFRADIIIRDRVSQPLQAAEAEPPEDLRPARIYDPERFSNYEQRNGVSDEREEELVYLVHSHWKEDVGDQGCS